MVLEGVNICVSSQEIDTISETIVIKLFDMPDKLKDKQCAIQLLVVYIQDYQLVFSVTTSSTGWNCILTSAISRRASFSVLVIFASSSDVSRTLSEEATSAVRSTNISDPARFARK